MTIIEAKKVSLFAVNVYFRHAITVLVPFNEGGGGGGGRGFTSWNIWKVGKPVVAFSEGFRDLLIFKRQCI